MATAIAGLGHNQPPEQTPYETMRLHIDELYDEAIGFLDGEPITTQEMADAIDKIKALALEANRDGEELRKAEAKPFDDGKKEVQARWVPLVDKDKGKCRLIITTCNKALAPFLQAEQAKKDATAAEQRRVADAAAAEARRLHDLAAAKADDLASVAAAEDAIKAAAKLERSANHAEKDRAQTKGGGRATSLRSVWSATITDRRAALNFYARTNPQAFVALIQSLADSEARHGPRTADGITFSEDKVAV